MKKASKLLAFWCASSEIRTRVLALKGLRPGPLDDGGAGSILPSVLIAVKRLSRNFSFFFQC